MTEEKKLVWQINFPKYSLDIGLFRVVNGEVGKPQAIPDLSEQELIDLGVVGIYKREGEQNFRVVSDVARHPMFNLSARPS